MLSTFEQPLPASRAAEIAVPYRANGSPVEGGPRVYPELAAAGLWTTPSDLARFALGVGSALKAAANAIVSAPMARAMLTPVLEGHGLGPRVGGSTSRKFFTHNGGNEGYRCLLVAYADGEGAVIMTNSDSGGVLTEEVMRSIAAAYGWPDFAPALRSLVDVKPERLARLIGVYEFDDGSIYIVRKHAGRLEGQQPGHAPVELFASSDHELFARNVDLVVGFEGADGTAMMMMIEDNVLAGPSIAQLEPPRRKRARFSPGSTPRSIGSGSRPRIPHPKRRFAHCLPGSPRASRTTTA